MRDDNVVDIRPDMRVPEHLSPAEALAYIRTLVEPVSYASGQRAVDLTFDGIRVLIEKALRPPSKQ